MLPLALPPDIPGQKRLDLFPIGKTLLMKQGGNHRQGVRPGDLPDRVEGICYKRGSLCGCLDHTGQPPGIMHGPRRRVQEVMEALITEGGTLRSRDFG